MKAWRGFFRESQDFCGYQAKSPRDKARWWLAFPGAWCRFHWYGLRDSARCALARAGWLVLWLLIAAPSYGQTPLLADVQAERAKYGAVLQPAEVAQLINAVAYKHQAEGWGLLRKGSGNSCPINGVFVSCDILVNRFSQHHFDVLRDWEGSAQPTWSDVGLCVISDTSGCEMSRFQEPFPPAGVPNSGTTVPNPGTIPPAPSVDLTGILYRLDALSAANADTRAALERMFADYMTRDNRTVAQLQALDQKVSEVKDKPGAIESTFGNRYVQLLLATLGAVITTQQVTK